MLSWSALYLIQDVGIHRHLICSEFIVLPSLSVGSEIYIYIYIYIYVCLHKNKLAIPQTSVAAPSILKSTWKLPKRSPTNYWSYLCLYCFTCLSTSS